MTRSIGPRTRRTRRMLAQLLAAAALTVSGAQLAQAQQPTDPQQGSTTTRAAKKAELKKLEQNGYQPTATDPHYPQDIQSAEKKANGGLGTPQPGASGQMQKQPQ